MKQFNYIISGLSLITSTMAFSQTNQTVRPNIIYVFPDQYRNDACGFWNLKGFREYRNSKGDPTITPNLNQFARESLVLTSAQSNNPVSSPHRAMLMTGMYSANKNGVPVNCNTNSPQSTLNPASTTIGDVFSQAGYDCAYIGKYHLDTPTPNDPNNPGHYVENKKEVWDAYTPKELRHGFNYWYSYGTFNEHKNPHYWDNDGCKHEPYEYSPIHEARKAVEYIKNTGNIRDPQKPFLMMLSMNPPHSPYNSLHDCMEEDYNLYKDIPLDSLLFRPNVDRSMKKMKAAPYYLAKVTGVDRAFGIILTTLKEMELDKNTIVVFTSDHGETMCSHGTTDPKNSPYAESMNVPFIIRYPQKIKPRVDSLLLSTPDIMPTLLGLAGLDKQIPTEVEGRNYSELFLDEYSSIPRPTSALYFKYADGKIFQKSMVNNYFPTSRGIKTAKYTLAFTISENRELKEILFFDDKKDPYQLKNLPLKGNEKIIKELCKELGRQLKSINDPWYKEKILNELISYK